MSKRRIIGLPLCVLVAITGTWIWFGGCSVSIYDDGITSSFTVGNKTITLTLGRAGVFSLTVGTPVTNIADAFDFLGGTPTDNPTSGSVRLRTSNVTLRSSTTEKGSVASQGVSGVARLRWAIDAPGAVDPCTTGIDLGTFDITVSPDGVINVVDEELSLTLAAVSLFLENNISMCLEMESDFAGVIEISGFDVIFGPSADPSANDGLTGTFELGNLGLTNVNLLGPGEAESDANLFTPGLVRNSTFDNLSINDLLTFRAVAGGVILDTVTCPRINQGDFFAIVEWDGFTLTCAQPITPDADQSQGCCLSDGTCEDLTSDACALRSGHPAGEGVSCSNTECTGACCISGPCVVATLECGTCESMTIAQCSSASGDFKGIDVACDPFPCPMLDFGDEPSQACCIAPATASDGFTCIEVPFDFCVEGGPDFDPQSFGTSCNDRPCPEACCFDDGGCVDGRLKDGCADAGGTPAGAESICSSSCQGACCKPNGSCAKLTLSECDTANGVYQGLGAACGSVTCPVYGGCCYNDTLNCFGPVTEDECRNGGGEPETSCDPIPDPCFFACCLPSGTCEDTSLSVDACNSQNGIVSARGTTCADITCLPAPPTKWVLAKMEVNPANNDSNWEAPPGRFEGSFNRYTVTETSILVALRDYDNGFEYYNITVQASFDAPPAELTPGDTVVLNVSFSHGGTMTSGNPGLLFQYWLDGHGIEPRLGYGYVPWYVDFNGVTSTTFSFVVPSLGSGSGSFELVAFLWNCAACNVYWTYEPG